jgi:hypothetical protein
MIDINELDWRTSRFSNGEGGGNDCVQVAPLPDGGTAVRHSQHPNGEVIFYTRREMVAFMTGVKAGEFDYLIEPTA